MPCGSVIGTFLLHKHDSHAEKTKPKVTVVDLHMCFVHLIRFVFFCTTLTNVVSGSIPSGVTGNFFPRLPMEPCALGSTQPLKMSIRKTPGGEGGRCVRVTTLPPS